MKDSQNLANCLLVIFGASGDLTNRKLLPALFDLYNQKLLPTGFAILGVSRTEFSDESFRNREIISIQKFANTCIKNHDEIKKFLSHVYYLTMNPSESNDYIKLQKKLLELNSHYSAIGNCIYYFSTPPSLYGTIAHNLGLLGMQQEIPDHTLGWKKVIIEKPFGYDLNSSREVNEKLLEVFNEDQIYRIDHYLGKETVQNVLVTRFSNGIFEPLWNRNYIHHVEITSSETLGIGDRGGYYDEAGALRDMLQNHLLQLVGLVAMEPPAILDANAIRNETLKVFESFRPIKIEDVPNIAIRGQYTHSIIKGESILGYREEKGVHSDSRTETYIALKFYIDNWRWGGVPFYIRTGKRLPTKVTEIVIHFNPTPHYLFNQNKEQCNSCNQLVIRIQPDDGLLLKFGMKVPGAGFEVQPANMSFLYSKLEKTYIPTAYERLLLDCIMGDATLYIRGDAVDACWKFVAPIQQAWQENHNIKIYGYPAGTWGPENADNLLGSGFTWRYPCRNLADDGSYCEL